MLRGICSAGTAAPADQGIMYRSSTTAVPGSSQYVWAWRTALSYWGVVSVGNVLVPDIQIAALIQAIVLHPVGLLPSLTFIELTPNTPPFNPVSLTHNEMFQGQECLWLQRGAHYRVAIYAKSTHETPGLGTKKSNKTKTWKAFSSREITRFFPLFRVKTSQQGSHSPRWRAGPKWRST